MNILPEFILSLLTQILGPSGTAVTYPGIGNFTNSDFYHPVNRPEVRLPMRPTQIAPTFDLFTRSNLLEKQSLLYNDTASFNNTNFDPKHETKMIVHGFMDNPIFGTWMVKMKNEFLKKDTFNVIIVNWHYGNFFPYSQAAANTRVVGPIIAILIENLCKTFNITPASFHIVGHSMGAHIAGYAGKVLKGKLGHITGLDPAGPQWRGLPAQTRLWYSDAIFVDSIHTDFNPHFPLGSLETFSHVDIFPNGGQMQLGCNWERFTSVFTRGIIEGTRRLIICDHQRSVDYYIESINYNGALVVHQCDNYELYQAGKCISCGHDGSRCAAFGPQAKEYVMNKTEVPQGKRFFMSTLDYEPYLGHQYLVDMKVELQCGHWNWSESNSITLRFMDCDGQVASLNVTHVPIVTTISQVYVLPVSLENVVRIEFTWSSGVLARILPSKVLLSDIKVTSLDAMDYKRKSFQFLSKENEVYSNQVVVFQKALTS